MAAVLEARTGEADVRMFRSSRSVCLPCKDGEGTRAYLAFRAMVVLQHLDIRVVGETVLADGGEVGRFPAGAVQVLLDLRRHSGDVQRL